MTTTAARSPAGAFRAAVVLYAPGCLGVRGGVTVSRRLGDQEELVFKEKFS
jgi:hypothetical protein